MRSTFPMGRRMTDTTFMYPESSEESPKSPCEGCKPQLASMAVAIAAIQTRLDTLVQGVNQIGDIGQAHQDTLQEILTRFGEFQRDISAMGPASMIRSLLGGPKRHG